MRQYRAVVGVLLAAIATFLVSCSSGPAAVAPTYTPEKIAQLQTYVSRIEASRKRLPELLQYIEKDNWVNVDNFTHGPLGQLRSELARLSSQLLPADQKKAKLLSEDILAHLQNLDEASQNRNYGEAITQYREFIGDFDALLGIVPEGARDSAKKAIAAPTAQTTRRGLPNLEDMRDAAEDMRDDAEAQTRRNLPGLDDLRDAAEDMRDAAEDMVNSMQ
jgi:photosystem II protein PsbQ